MMYSYAVFIDNDFVSFFATYDSAFNYCMILPSEHTSIFRLEAEFEAEGYEND